MGLCLEEEDGSQAEAEECVVKRTAGKTVLKKKRKKRKQKQKQMRMWARASLVNRLLSKSELNKSEKFVYHKYLRR